MSKLGTFSQIFSGYTFRKPLEDQRDLPIGVVSLKDIYGEKKEIHYDGFSTIDHFSGDKRHYLQNHDVLLISRGLNNFAFLFEIEKQFQPTVASGSLIVIRTMPEYLNPLYLAWYLNLSKSQKEFKKLQTGTTVPHLTIASLLDFDINIPTKHKQMLIGEVYLKLLEDQKITRERENKFQQLLNESMLSIIS